jgi:hypothetical protein
LIEENRAEVKEQLEAWGAEISELDDEQREIEDNNGGKPY